MAKKITQLQKEPITLEKLSSITGLDVDHWKLLANEGKIAIPGYDPPTLPAAEKGQGDNPLTDRTFTNLMEKLLGRVDNMNDNLGTRIDTMTEKLVNRMDGMEEKIVDSITTLGDRLEPKIDTIVAKIDVVGQNVQTVHNKLDEVGLQIANNNKTVLDKMDVMHQESMKKTKSISSRIDDINIKVCSNNKMVMESMEAFQGDTMKELKAQSQLTNHRVKSHQSTIDIGIQDLITRIKDQRMDIHESNSAVHDKLNEVSQKLDTTALQNQLDRVACQLDKAPSATSDPHCGTSEQLDRMTKKLDNTESLVDRHSSEIKDTLDASVLHSDNLINSLSRLTTDKLDRLSNEVARLTITSTPVMDAICDVIPTDRVYRRSGSSIPKSVSKSLSGSVKSSTKKSKNKSRHHTTSESSDSSSSNSTTSDSSSSHEDRRHDKKSAYKGPQTPKLSTFDGDPTKWRSFIFMFKLLAKNYKWSSKVKLQKLTECLRDKAVEYLQSRPSKVRKNFKVLVKDLKKRFDQDKAPAVTRRQLVGLQQEEFETVELFSDRVHTMVRDGYPKAKESMVQMLASETFLSGCKDKRAAMFASEKNPKTISKALSYVKSAATNSKMVGSRPTNIRQVSFSSESDSHVYDKPRQNHQANEEENRMFRRFLSLMNNQLSSNVQENKERIDLRPNYSPTGSPVSQYRDYSRRGEPEERRGGERWDNNLSTTVQDPRSPEERIQL